jgi:CelD/BcsL family acetyltransferase involved in cellulose biosynthesis
MPGSAEEFWQRLSPKVRKNQQWQARKLLSNHSGAVRIDCFTQACELDRVLQDVEYVATKTYQRALGVGFRASAEMRRRLQLRIERGCFRGYVLYIENRPSAFWLGTVYNQDFHSDFMGYDPENAKYSPGMYLITNVIQDLCSHNKEVRKITAIDFGLGDAQYKEVLGNLEWQDVSIHLFGSTFRGRILQIVSLPMLLLDRAVRSVLRHWDLFSKVKKLWRRRAVLSLNASSREPSGHAKSTKSHNY